MNRARLLSRLTIAVPAAIGLLAVGGGVGNATPTSSTTASTTASTSSTPSSTAKKCDATPWASRVQGSSHVTAHSRGGVYLGHTKTGFKLRVTHKGTARVVYSGVITSSAPMRMGRVKLEKGDVAKLSADRKSIVFAFADHGFIDGVNFHTDCAQTVTLSHLNAGSKALSHKRVFLGAKRVHPKHVPFTLHRTKPATTPAPAA